MAGFHARKEITINAPIETVFKFAGDITQHARLAGSGEVKAIRKLTEGPVKVGAKFEADEDFPMGPGMRTKFVSKSEVVAYEPPRLFSWTSMPPSAPKPKSIQWWFRLSPEGRGTRIVHEVVVDFGTISNILMGPPYAITRGRAVSRGMGKTLQNLKSIAESEAKSPA
jgi:uncharacterized protein YndB with AHSA1/START domain